MLFGLTREVLTVDDLLNCGSNLELDDSDIFIYPELCDEYIDVLQLSNDCIDGLNMETASFKETIRSIFDKVINAIISALKFIGKILLFPFKIIGSFIKRLKEKSEYTATQIESINVLNKYKMHIRKSLTGGFSDRFVDLMSLEYERTACEYNQIEMCKEYLEFGKKIYVEAAKELSKNGYNIDELDVAIQERYNDYNARLKKYTDKLNDFINVIDDTSCGYIIKNSKIKKENADILAIADKIFEQLEKSYDVRKNSELTTDIANSLIK